MEINRITIFIPAFLWADVQKDKTPKCCIQMAKTNSRLQTGSTGGLSSIMPRMLDGKTSKS